MKNPTPKKNVQPTFNTNKQLKNWLSIAEALLSNPSAPLREDLPKAHIVSFVKARSDLSIQEDASGNLLVKYPAKNKASARPSTPPLVMVAHLDHPGFWIEKVSGREVQLAFKGFVAEPHAIDGSSVAFYQDGQIQPTGHGTIHSAKYVKGRLVSAGATLTRGDVYKAGYAMWNFPGFSIKDGRIVTRCCDDLLGAAAALSVLDEIVSRKPQSQDQDVEVWALFTRAEEVGFLGTLEAIRHKSIPKNARVLSLECSKAFVNAPQGDGVIVRVGDKSSIFNPLITEALRQAAEVIKKRDPSFKYQRKLMDGGSCEATAFCAFGFASSGLAVPLGNYHNQAFNEKTGIACIGPEHVLIEDWRCEIELLIELALHPEFLSTKTLNKPTWLLERIELAKKVLPASKGTANQEAALRFNHYWML